MQTALAGGQDGISASVRWGTLMTSSAELPNLESAAEFIREVLKRGTHDEKRTMLWLLRRYCEGWLQRSRPPSLDWLDGLSNEILYAAVPRFRTRYTTVDDGLIPIALALLKNGTPTEAAIVQAALSEAQRLGPDLPIPWRRYLENAPTEESDR